MLADRPPFESDMDPLSSSERALPLACTLGPSDGPARLRRWHALLSTSGVDLHHEPGSAVATFADRGVLEELDALVHAERACCGFVSWSVEDSGDAVRLRVAGSPDGVRAVLASIASRT